jgi:hypothetical protein
MTLRTLVRASTDRLASTTAQLRAGLLAGPLACVVTGLFAGTAFGAETLSIKTLAPEKSILVIGVDDFEGTRARFERTPIGAWWNSPEVQEKNKQFREQLNKGFDEMTQELGVPRETLTFPASMGAAIFAELNEETGSYEPGLMLFVDWGKEAENFGKLYDAAIAKMEKDAPDQYTVEEIKGRRVFVNNAKKVEEPAAEEGEEEDPFADFDSGPDMFEKFCFTRDGGRLLVAGSPGSMQELLTSLENDKRKSVSDSEDFRATLEMAGGKDMYVTLLTDPAQQLVAGVGPEVGMLAPFLGQLFGDIRGYGMGVTLDGADAPVESTISMYIPGPKVGLLSLLPAGAVEKLPSIIPADAMSYAHMNFNFGGLMKVIDEFIGGLPPQFGDEIKAGLEPFDPVLRSAFGGMGPGMHVWGTMKQPITIDSARTTVAIATSDKDSVQKAVQTFAPMGGLAPRDFVGNTIYSADDDFVPFALGLGGSYMFVGQTESVEQSLRALGADGESTLAADPTYKAVLPHWKGDDLVGYGFTNTVATMEAQEAMFAEIMPMLEGVTPDAAENLPVDLDGMLTGLMQTLDPKLMKNYFGPSTWTFRSVKSGFRFETRLLPVTK